MIEASWPLGNILLLDGHDDETIMKTTLKLLAPSNGLSMCWVYITWSNALICDALVWVDVVKVCGVLCCGCVVVCVHVLSIHELPNQSTGQEVLIDAHGHVIDSLSAVCIICDCAVIN